MQKPFYLTTAINYANGSPHLGHAYEAICADVYRRFMKVWDQDVILVTGADEHGQKIADTAKKCGLSEIELCDKYVQEFQTLNAKLDVQADIYIRTTSIDHQSVALAFWQKIEEAGDIYLSTYTGWYNVREESYVTPAIAELNNYVDPVTGLALVKHDEPSFFFRLSKYRDEVLNVLKENPPLIEPVERYTEIINRLESEPLADLSISRAGLKWGIEIPNTDHVMYVWFDALTNYLSAISEDFNCWPADVHIIGKDIVWFHAVIWLAMLLSAKISLPKKILSHGFIRDGTGKKMSKSCGNVINPNELIDKYGSEAFRFALFFDAGRIGDDIKIDAAKVSKVHDEILAASFGNLIARTQNVIKSHRITFHPLTLIDRQELETEIKKLFESYQWADILTLLLNNLNKINAYVSSEKPWQISDTNKLNFVLSEIVQSIHLVSIYLEPFLPKTIATVFNRWKLKRILPETT